MIALDVEDAPVPVWLRRRDRFGGKGQEWKRGICWKAACTGIGIVVGIAFLTLLVSPTKYKFLFPNGNSKLPTSTNPNITYLQPQFFHNLDSERVKIKYGPFLVPGNDMANFQLPRATKPCSDCIITYMQASLEYEDETIANANTGMWLHHMVLLNPTQADTVCPTQAERVFASGNERTPANICVDGTKEAGYHLTSTSTLHLSPEFMNETPSPISVYITILYEYIPSPPPSFLHVKPIWLDITGQCGNSSYPVPSDETSFSVTAEPWTSNISGEIIFTATHLHDGGIDVKVLRGEEEACVSVATYGGAGGYVESSGMEHVSDMSVCTEIGRMEMGEEWSLVVGYDLDEHEPMKGLDGGLEPVMGIALLYVAENVEKGLD